MEEGTASTGAPGHRLGRRGEALAAAYLERNGWRIVAHNWRFHRKEIDLVARRGALVAFVEVKSRGRGALGHPLDAITPEKRRELTIAARGWVAARGRTGDVYRFDAVSVISDRRGTRVEHFEDAWRL